MDVIMETGKAILYCQKCGDGTGPGGGLFRLSSDNPIMVCCKCKYGEPMRPESMHPQTLFSSRPQPKDLDWYDKNYE